MPESKPEQCPACGSPDPVMDRMAVPPGQLLPHGDHQPGGACSNAFHDPPAELGQEAERCQGCGVVLGSNEPRAVSGDKHEKIWHLDCWPERGDTRYLPTGCDDRLTTEHKLRVRAEQERDELREERGWLQITADRADLKRCREALGERQAAIDKADSALTSSAYVGGPSEREAWQTALGALGQFRTEHVGDGRALSTSPEEKV